MNCSIDPNFDFNSDTPPNKDPDSFSPTFRSYHKILLYKASHFYKSIDIPFSEKA